LVAFVLITIFGKLGSYQAIIIICFGIPLIAIASGLIKFQRHSIFFKVYLWFSFVLISLNIIANLLGKTLFEKIIMTLVAVIQAILYFRLARDKDN